MSRFDVQTRFEPFGRTGQAALERSRIAIVGVGALGSAAAEMLARSGAGTLTLIDRDVVEIGNLHRQSLYDEDDVAAARPKAVAAAAHLRRIRSDLGVEPRVEDLDGRTASDLLGGCDLILDGSDNFEARCVIGEAALESGTPWIHAACQGSRAVVWPLVPGRACFACLLPEPPRAGEAETCDVSGVLPPAVHVAAAVQVAEALKLLAGATDRLLPGPWSLDTWTGRSSAVRAERDPDCPACARGERRWLGGARAGDVLACGRGGVQLAGRGRIDLGSLARRLEGRAELTRNEFLLRFAAGDGELTVFRDGRVLVAGTRDPARARALAARWLGG